MRWNPDQYLKFADQRQRPALDLLARIPLDQANVITDLGCGPGNMARPLSEAFPDAHITGIDSSSDMLDKAQKEFPKLTWQQADIATWKADHLQDLIYSNAALHWLGDHENLFVRLMGFLKPGGVLAVQMPNQFDQPSHILIQDVAKNGPWADRLKFLLRPAPVAEPHEYRSWLSPHAKNIDIWQTTYKQKLHGQDPVLDWISSTALKPFTDALPDDQQKVFKKALALKLKQAYPNRPDGTTLFPFKRLFMIATNL